MARQLIPLVASLFALAPIGSLAMPAAPSPAPTPPASMPATVSETPVPARPGVAGPATSPLARALASPVPIWIRNGLLVEQGGRALYVFDHDLIGESQCDTRCMALWPPHYAEPGATPHGPFTLARATDGRTMWAYRGKPLYRWLSDRKRGAAGGDGVAGVWFLARVPAATAAQVVPYFPMPRPRPGTMLSPSAAPSRESGR